MRIVTKMAEPPIAPIMRQPAHLPSRMIMIYNRLIGAFTERRFAHGATPTLATPEILPGVLRQPVFSQDRFPFYLVSILDVPARVILGAALFVLGTMVMALSRLTLTHFAVILQSVAFARRFRKRRTRLFNFALCASFHSEIVTCL